MSTDRGQPAKVKGAPPTPKTEPKIASPHPEQSAEQQAHEPVVTSTATSTATTPELELAAQSAHHQGQVGPKAETPKIETAAVLVPKTEPPKTETPAVPVTKQSLLKKGKPKWRLIQWTGRVFLSTN